MLLSAAPRHLAAAAAAAATGCLVVVLGSGARAGRATWRHQVLGTLPQQQHQRRSISEEQLSASQDHLQDLFQRNLDKASRKRPDTPIRTTRREALALYREILRYSNLFVWKDAQGRPWRDVIRVSARKEYEDARVETDPEIINKLIITGRDAVQRTVEAFMRKRRGIIEEEAALQERGGGLPPPPPLQ